MICQPRIAGTNQAGMDREKRSAVTTSDVNSSVSLPWTFLHGCTSIVYHTPQLRISMPLTNLSSSAEGSLPGVALSSNQNRVNANGADRFIDRRRSQSGDRDRPERRQFGSSHAGLSDAGRELAFAIDQYKIQHHRRYLTCDEMLLVLERLGYAKHDPSIT